MPTFRATSTSSSSTSMTSTPRRSGREVSGRWARSGWRRRSPMPSITRPANASASCRCTSRICSPEGESEELLAQPAHSGEAVETGVIGHDVGDAVTPHQRQMQSIAGREALAREQEFLGTLEVGKLDREDLVHHSEESVEGGLNPLPLAQGIITVKDFLQNLGIGDQSLAGHRGSLEEALRSLPVRMRTAHDIHGDVRVDEDHSTL